ncbi:MAG TPA: twin transmembrane helix small protein [Usitatibacter sp.]|nr:twin transmembrane helix small protein [Usitatibacter sp.]
MKILIILLVLAVATSLFSGLYFVGKDRGGGNRVLVSLSIRLGLSFVVFAVLMASHYFGWSVR